MWISYFKAAVSHVMFVLCCNVKPIKSRLMRLVGHLASMREIRNAFSMLIGNLNVTDIVIDERIILKRNF